MVFSVAFIQKSTHLLVNMIFNLQKCHYLRKCYVNKYFELVISFLKSVFMKLSAKFLLCRIIRLEKFETDCVALYRYLVWRFSNLDNSSLLYLLFVMAWVV